MLTKKKILNILSWALGLTAMIILMYRINKSFSKQEFQASIHSLFHHHNFLYVLLAVILMPINWFIECWKWYLITLPVEKIKFKTAIASVLVGLVYGHLLPARSSEFIGKILFFSDKNKSNIIVLHFINSMVQLYITVSVGIFFLLFELNIPYFKIIISFSILIFLLLSLALIYSNKLHLLVKEYLLLNYDISYTTKLKLIILSLLRYVVFIIQFYYVFLIYNHHQTLHFDFVSKISLYFLLTSIIPMISIVEVFIRAVIGIIAFQGLGINEIQITFITTLIWFINLAIPSIVGFFIWIFSLKK